MGQSRRRKEPVEGGRLGVFNVALVGKRCWRMLMELESLWYRVLKARYGEYGEVTGGRVREGFGEGVGRWFDNNIRREVGNRRNTLFWYDTWVWEVPLSIKFPRLFDLAMNKESMVEEMWRLGWLEGGGAWSWHRRKNITDTWRWLLDPIKGYTDVNSRKQLNIYSWIVLFLVRFGIRCGIGWAFPSKHGPLFRGELYWVLMALMEYHVEGTATKVHQIPSNFVHLAKACMQIHVEKKQPE
ncbi:transmembrane protein, putative [Medicago truncatula]|uniref:Transmembrane protein, putative n=1 Tax=Medicago truncatula TaxID=3880 RepID=A0A072VKN5_MEDTR|nr:transmembrane protein, putative [Medicago truncatula]